MANVIELKERQNRELDAPKRDVDVLEAMWWGIQHSVHAKNPDCPDAEPSLAQFCRVCCDQSPLTMLKILSKFED